MQMSVLSALQVNAMHCRMVLKRTADVKMMCSEAVWMDGRGMWNLCFYEDFVDDICADKCRCLCFYLFKSLS